MTGWVEEIELRARMIHNEIASWRVRSNELGIDPEVACSRFYKLLDEIYSNDLPLAKARDNSDLLLHVEGRGVEDAPRLSLVSGLFNNVKLQVRDLTKAIVGISSGHRVTVHDIDLGLSGLAKGSLFVGFNVPLPREQNKNISLLGAEDPLYKATKDALKIINTVSHRIDMRHDDVEATHHIAEAIKDPKLRDAALVAVKRISPSKKSGVDRIGVTSSHTAEGEASLTPEVRHQIGKMLQRPVVGNEYARISGIVREIDLDAKRFEIRGITDHQVQDIRCVYLKMEASDGRKLLNARVRVSGVVERRADEAPRLLSVDEVEYLDKSDNQPQLV